MRRILASETMEASSHGRSANPRLPVMVKGFGARKRQAVSCQSVLTRPRPFPDLPEFANETLSQVARLRVVLETHLEHFGVKHRIWVCSKAFPSLGASRFRLLA